MTMANGIRAVASSHFGAPVARDPLLPRQDVALAPPKQLQPREASDGQQPVDAGGGGGFRWLPTAEFANLTFIFGLSLHGCWPDPGDVAFVLSSYLGLILLFWVHRRYERAEPGSSLKEWLKLPVWLLTSAITLVSSYELSAMIPAAVAAVVWVMALVTICGGFLSFFCFPMKT